MTARPSDESLPIQLDDNLCAFVQTAASEIAIFDKDMRYLAVSRPYLESYGLLARFADPRELIGLSHYDIFPEIGAEWRAVHERCLAGAVETATQESFSRLDGLVDLVTWTLRPLHDLSGSICGLILSSRVEAAAEGNSRPGRRRLAIHGDPSSAVCRIDARGLITYANAFYGQWVGADTDVLIGSRWRVETRDHDPDIAGTVLSILSPVNQVTTIEALTSPPKGGERWLRFVIRGFFDDSGRLLEAQIMGRDLSDPRMMHIAVDRLNWALRACMRAASAVTRFTEPVKAAQQACEAIVSGDYYSLAFVGLAEAGAGKAVRVLAQSGRASGYLSGICIGWDETTPEGRGPAGQAIRSGRPRFSYDTLTDVQFAPWRERASQFGIRSSATLPLKIGERIFGVLVVYADVADAFGEEAVAVFERLADELALAMIVSEDRDRLNAAREAATENYRRLFDYAPVSIIVIATKPVGNDANPHALRMFGYSAEDFAQIEPEDLVVRAEDEPHMTWTKADGRREWTFRRRDGSTFPAAVHTTPMPDGKTLGIIRDITDQRRAEEAERREEEALRETAAQLARLSRISALGEMVATISHEINQPLAANYTNCAAAIRWLDHDPPNTREARRNLEAIKRESERANAVIGRIRSFHTKGERKLGTFELSRAIDEALSLTTTERRAAKVALARVDENVQTSLWGHRIEIEQVLINLITNAVDAMKDVKTRPRILSIRSHETEDGATIIVEDTGAGLSVENQDKIFQPYFTTKPDGTGLGLAICRSILEAHGGRIRGEPRTPYGAVFTLTLPNPIEAKLTVAGKDLPQ